MTLADAARIVESLAEGRTLTGTDVDALRLVYADWRAFRELQAAAESLARPEPKEDKVARIRGTGSGA